MPPLVEILSYLVFTGFMFAAVCAMTRGGRGWPWRVLTLGELVGVDVAVETCWQMGEMPFDLWLAICFCAKGGILAASVFVLSRDPPGRRLFLSIVYCAYAACYAVERTTLLPDTELVSLVANLVENAIEASGEKLKLGVEVEERNCSDSDSAGQPVDATSSSRQNKDVASSDRRDGDVASTKERGHRSSTSTLNFDSSPQVTCTLRQRGDMFGITVTNPVPEGFSLSPAGWPCTAWGVGLSSVGRIVAKYRGEWRYRIENGLLSCSVAVYAEGKR